MGDNENLLDALNVSNTDGEVDYKSKFEELQKTLQSERVEAGRLKKANEEIASLRSELEKVNARSRTQAAIDSLDEDDRDALPEDYQRGAARLAQTTVDQSLAERDERIARLEARLEANDNARRGVSQREFVNQINSSYPGFLEGIKPGGDKYDAWKQYQRFNSGSIKSAMENGDYEALGYHINQFYSNFLGVSVPSVSDGATPEPRTVSGVGQMSYGGGRNYTIAEYQQILEKAQEDFQSHRINVDRYTSICNELNNAYRQGRVKE